MMMPLWIDVGTLDDIPPMGARVVKSLEGDIALFRTADDRVFALYDRCPHKGGPLSQGIVHGASVTCPLHAWVISLETGAVEGPDEGCVHRIAVELTGGRVLLGLPASRLVANG
ncbi:nitrite reductase (NADH) small subunit [Inquilinus ginsengisoli]|uniref:Nitrite reductase (NADH) small subunit n=1 Tax=Inquilinus ginsengisoli TaxID=363840 RepID=A0ABU1JJU0_9PROT|nr:nitrite reductase small subunit NirD [Inquilinus ginsengisoli]MDR6287839.1 nitrite reductase (NADH) small subunit [Inquilinus ginsengisoli]